MERSLLAYCQMENLVMLRLKYHICNDTICIVIQFKKLCFAEEAKKIHN